MIGGPLNEFEKTVRNANETKCRQHNVPRGSQSVDWSALVIDLWRHLDGSCPSRAIATELGRPRHVRISPLLATELRTSLVVRFVPFPEFGAVLNDFRFGKWKWQENNDRMYRNSTRMAVSRSRPLAAC